MKLEAGLLVVGVSFCCAGATVLGQVPGSQFQVTKIIKNLVPTPLYSYSGGQPQQGTVNQRDRWLEVEVQFSSTAEWTDDLTLRYFILVNGSVLSGEVTHTNVAGGRECRSVMYVPPKVLARVMNNRPLTASSVENIAVQIVQQGSVKAEQSLAGSSPQWYKGLPSLSGLVLNKNETPFAPLNWDRYEQIKPTR